MSPHLVTKGKSTSNASALPTIANVKEHTLRPTNTEFSDVATNETTDWINNSGPNNFMAVNVSNGNNIFKPLLMHNHALNWASGISVSSDTASGTTTTTSGSIS